MKSKKVKKQEIHGAVSTPKSIYELAGMKTNVFKHKTKEEYEAWLDSTPLTDLQNHAIDVGLVPVDNRDLMRERLLREYCRETGKALAIAAKQPDVPTKKSETKLKDLLKRGR